MILLASLTSQYLLYFGNHVVMTSLHNVGTPKFEYFVELRINFKSTEFHGSSFCQSNFIGGGGGGEGVDK